MSNRFRLDGSYLKFDFLKYKVSNEKKKRFYFFFDLFYNTIFCLLTLSVSAYMSAHGQIFNFQFPSLLKIIFFVFIPIYRIITL